MPQPRKSLEDHKLQNTKPQYVEPTSDVPAGRPKYPSGISPAAKSTFKRLVRLLESRRTCTAGDAEILRLYAIAFSRHVRALEHLEAEGEICAYTRLDSNGQPHQQFKENLWLKTATDAEKFMRACLADLGLNPLQRSKVRAVEEKKPDSPTDDFPTREQHAAASDEINLDDFDENVVIN